MPRKTRVHITDGDTQTMTPKHLTKQEFGKRLYSLLLTKGWNQSELARRAGLNRDAVSTYIRGKVLPTPISLDAIAKALEVDPKELLPNHVHAAIEADEPALEIKVSTSALHMAWLRVNQLVTISTAVKIAELLEADHVAEGSGSGGAVAVQPVESEETAPERETPVRGRKTGARR